jgi:hypothetical protein
MDTGTPLTRLTLGATSVADDLGPRGAGRLGRVSGRHGGTPSNSTGERYRGFQAIRLSL